ncbi:hypothetical protein [Streptomyces sp. SID3343]|uniref:hypothetical protein n=1 Tax=Streptomyces sp. SID3343 TaxID=2690260 RepID=UPI00136D74B4|nr:hypothetical protein [Streptomyces sp. SID3343]MYV99923.1 hypothetical protein [Streptomyces sp. SID3343]
MIEQDPGYWAVYVGYDKTGGDTISRRFGHMNNTSYYWADWGTQYRGETGVQWPAWGQYGCNNVVGLMEAQGNGVYRIPPMNLC